MRRAKGRLFAAALCAALAAPQAGWAWGGEAHRVVALVADKLLVIEAPAARAKLQQILASDKDNEWTKTDIASEATWPDMLLDKSQEGRVATSEWHYARLDPAHPDLNKDCFGRPPLPAGYPASHGPRDNCIVDKIEQFSRELREPQTSSYERLAAVQFLLNLVADLHDPVSVIDHKDMHGECLALQFPHGKPVRLRTYWDDTAVAEALGKDPDAAAERLVDGLTQADIAAWSSLGPEAWVQESYAVARSAVYALPAEAADGTYALPGAEGDKDPCGGTVKLYRADARYQKRAAATVRQQLARAGVRLAYLLREDLR
jgi:hypothetical protein